MRRVVVTPTFAAGLGVVVAAVLALQMHTVFNYAAPNGTTCQMAGCGVNSQTGGHTASGHNHRLGTPGSGAAHSGSDGSTSHDKSAPARGGGGSSPVAAAPQLSYQTSSKADWGFAGTIVLTFKPEFTHQRWRLRFSYPSARILRVWAGKYLHIQHSRHSALVASLSSRAQGGFPRQVRVSIEVAGRPGPPLRCLFNGHGCHFGGHAGQGGPSHGGPDPRSSPKPTGSPKPKAARSRKPANALS
jgi:hypothetical protein